MTAEELEALLDQVPVRAAADLPTWSGRSWTALGSSFDSPSLNVSAYQAMAPGNPGGNPEEYRANIELAVKARQSAIAPRIEPFVLSRLESMVTPCALIVGPTGCGKTSGAAWIMGRFGGRLLRARDLAAANRRHGLGDGIPRELELAQGRAMLVIDDVGTEGSDVAALQDALDYRYGKCFPTVVTSGMTLGELEGHIGTATFRRIIDQHVNRHKVLVINAHPKSPQ